MHYKRIIKKKEGYAMFVDFNEKFFSEKEDEIIKNSNIDDEEDAEIEELDGDNDVSESFNLLGYLNHYNEIMNECALIMVSCEHKFLSEQCSAEEFSLNEESFWDKIKSATSWIWDTVSGAAKKFWDMLKRHTAAAKEWVMNKFKRTPKEELAEEVHVFDSEIPSKVERLAMKAKLEDTFNQWLEDEKAAEVVDRKAKKLNLIKKLKIAPERLPNKLDSSWAQIWKAYFGQAFSKDTTYKKSETAELEEQATRWSKMVSFFKNAFNKIKSFFSSVIQKIKNVFSKKPADDSKVEESVLRIFSEEEEANSDEPTQVKGGVFGKIKDATNFVIGYLNELISKIGNAMRTAWNALKKFVSRSKDGEETETE